MAEDQIFSRPEKAAAQLGDAAADRHRFVDKRVLLTGEAAMLVTANGQAIARDSLMLLMRICSNVTVWVPESAGPIKVILHDTANALEWKTPIRFIGGPQPDLSSFDAILNVGAAVRPDLQWTSINSNGWLARVSSGNRAIAATCDQFNPVGAFGAACLGVTDVFKRLIRLKPECGGLFNGLTVSFWTYEFDVEAPGPDMPKSVELDIVVAGGGAIGNGITHLIRQLPVRGRAQVIDNQTYGPENWGTCVAMGPTDENSSKAEVMARLLGDCLDTVPHNIDIVDEVAKNWRKVAKMIRPNTVVLNGFDNIEARHAIQKLWPDIVIDGAIGADFSCQVSAHPWGTSTACLMCVFRDPASERADRLASRATGIRENRILATDAIVTDQDIELAPDNKKEFLREKLGQTICSVVSEGVAAQMSEDKQRAGFAPSVPFVAGYSACMVIAEFVRYVTTGRNLAAPRYQLNLLWGPRYGLDYPELRHHDCLCSTRAGNIEKIRRAREAPIIA